MSNYPDDDYFSSDPSDHLPDAGVSAKQCILIIDDLLANIETLVEILGEHYDIIFALNGKDGIAKALKHPVDLILLDVKMPGLDGYEVCKILKSKAQTHDIPVIFVTALSTTSDEAKGLDLGAIDYIIKPFSVRIIEARIRNHMELVRHRKALRALSLLDGLTGLPNRRQFDQVLEKEWHRGLRQQVALSVLLIDIDQFKTFNDYYGHQEGDFCLQCFAEIINGCKMRTTDFVARYGGEEFVAILPGTNYQGALHMARRMLAELRGRRIPHAVSEIDKVVTASIGVYSAVPGDKATAELMLKKADRALYDAKSAGRNQVVAFYDGCHS